MATKIIITILILLAIISGGLGYYSYTLNQQIALLSESLSEQLFNLQVEQATQVAEMNEELGVIRAEITTQASRLEEEIGGTVNDIGALKTEISGTNTRIDTLENKVGTATAEISELVIDASEIYKNVRQAVVRISTGDRTIGSGFILDRDSHVVTAQHVVERLTDVYVITADGRVSRAIKVAGSTYSDVAVLTLEDKLNIAPPPVADSNKVNIGDPVATIGSPLDLPETLTTGIVSGANRFARIEYDTQFRWISNLIQFDAAVNYGNSGGLLVNSTGGVIGLVIARVNPSEGDGIYYAVSSNKLKRVATVLITNGYYDYPWLGVEITDLSPRMVESRALDSANGVLVERPTPGSPAEAAGVKGGDIITAMDGVALKSVGDFTSYLGEYKSPGDKTRLTIIRGASRLEISVDIGKRS